MELILCELGALASVHDVQATKNNFALTMIRGEDAAPTDLTLGIGRGQSRFDELTGNVRRLNSPIFFIDGQ